MDALLYVREIEPRHIILFWYSIVQKHNKGVIYIYFLKKPHLHMYLAKRKHNIYGFKVQTMEA